MRKIALLSLFIATTALAIFTSATVKQIDTIKNNTSTDITIDPTGDLILTSATANRVPYFDASKKLFSSSVTDTELAYLSGVTSAIQTQLNSKAADADVVKITGDQSIAGIKTFTGQIIASTTSNGNRPCPTMTEAQRDAISSPVLGDCVTNSDTSSLNIYDGTAWGAVGGGGQGGINYIEQYNAESSITDWVTYADVAGVNAVDGTGGTANITWTKNSSFPLIEANDFKLTKDAADRQGEGVAVPFTIDSGYQSNKIYISFKYDASSASYADDDIRIQIYDVTNSRLIRVNGEDLKGTTKGNYLGWFQSSADSTSYRLIFHISSTNANAYDVYFDNVQVGPREVSYGSAITDEVNLGSISVEATTSNPTKSTTPTIDEYILSRRGEKAVININYYASSTTGSSAGSGDYIFKMPSGYKIKPDNINFYSTVEGTGNYEIRGATAVGTFIASNSAGSEPIQGIVIPYNEDGFRLFAQRAASASAAVVGNSYFALNDTGIQYSINIEVPIKGWSSNSIQSEDIGNREIVVKAQGNSATTLTSNVTPVPFNTTIKDTTGSWNGTQFNVPESGIYAISGAIVRSASADYKILRLYKNNSSFRNISSTPNGVSSDSIFFSVYEEFNKGDVIELRIGDSNTTLLNSAAHNIHIQKIAQPQTLLETETVAARYTSNSGQSIPNVEATFIYEDIDLDTHNAYNTSTGVYTIPVSGWYIIDASFITQAFSTASTLVMRINVDGAAKKTTTTINTGLGGEYTCQIQHKIYLTKNQQVEIRKLATAGTVSAAAISASNTFSIARIK